jgi:hypothetical protein
VADWAGIEDPYKDEDKETFDQTKDEDKKELGCETFQIEPSLKKPRHIEDEGAGEGVEAETISRKEVHEKSHEEG